LFGAAFSIIAFIAILFIIIMHLICSCYSDNFAFLSLFVCLNSRIPWTHSKVECITYA
jgi:hypothetical protein